jgi:hypothetical protein
MNEHINKADSINIDIGRLIIDGIELTLNQRLLLRESMETTLRGLIAEHGINGNIASASKIPGETIHLTQHAVEPVSLGKQIAGSVYQGLGKQ